jgi:hypothetical protein
MKLIQELSQVTEGRMKEAIIDLIDKAMDLVDVHGMTHDEALKEIADKVHEMDHFDIAADHDALMSMINDMYGEEDHADALKEDEADDNWPKLIGKAGDFSLEVDENEKVTLLKNHQEIVSMPLVIWKQLARA